MSATFQVQLAGQTVPLQFQTISWGGLRSLAEADLTVDINSRAAKSANLSDLEDAAEALDNIGGVAKTADLSDLSDHEKANRNLGVFATKALAEAQSIPVVLTTITLRGYSAAGDGGGADYKRAASEPTHDGKLQSADGAWWEIAEPVLTPAMFGAKCDDPGDGTGTDDSAALLALVTAAKAIGLNEVSLPKGSGHYNVGSTGWTVPGDVSVIGRGSPLIVFSGSLGVKVNNASGSLTRCKQYTGFGVVRSSRTWTDGTDTSSIAFEAVNIRESVFALTQLDDACVGFMMTGDGTGAVDNVIYPGLWRNNRFGIQCTRANGGWANQNNVIGGAIRNDSNTANILGYEPTLIDRVDNAWRFVSVNLEGGIQTPGMIARFNASYCVLDNCRYDGQGDDTIVIEATATGSQVLGGYNFTGPGDPKLVDSGVETITSGNRGVAMYGDTTNPAYIGRSRTSNSAVVFQAQSTSGVPFLEILGIGTINGYDGAGKGTVANPSIRFNPSNSSLDFGDTTGTNAPVAAIRAANTSLEYLAKLHLFGGTGRRGLAATNLADGATSISGSTGARYVTANTGATSISALSGFTAGQEFCIQAGDANTSLVFGSTTGLRRNTTKGGAGTVAMDSGEVRWFIATASNTAWEV